MADPGDAIRRSSLNLFKRSKRLAEFAEDVIVDLYQRTRVAIMGAAEHEARNTVTIAGQNKILKELEGHLTAARTVLSGEFKAEYSDIYEEQFSEIPRQLQIFETTAPAIGQEAIRLASTITPRISSNLIRATLDNTLHLLSKALDEVKPQLRRQIALNVLAGDSYYDLMQAIQGVGIVKGPFKTVAHRARAIAITETTNAYNGSRYEAIREVNRRLDKGRRIRFKWVALLDQKTSERCRSLHGQVRAQGEDFVASDGWRGKMPSAHPHCRSEIVPWRPEWDQIFADFEASLKTGD